MVTLSLNVKERVYLPPISDGHAVFPADPYEIFSIGICMSGTSDETYALMDGFRSILNDLGVKNNYEFNYKILSANNPESMRYAISNLISGDCDLLFPIGYDALSASLLFAPNTPIVMAGVIDFSDFIYTNIDGDQTRDFTGVSSLPNTELVLSTLIEATDKIDGVGLLYSLEDTQSVYQMRRLEQMLTQAKIPWKEYALDVPSEEEENIEDSVDESEETDETIGDTIASVSNRVRTPRRSLNWSKNPNIAPVTPENPVDDETSEESEAFEDEETDSFFKTVELASTECSALFIPKDSLVCSKINEISEMVIPSGTTTVTNDAYIGRDALVSTFSNPYQQGRSAGYKAFNILANRQSVQDIEISEISLEKSQKLYSKHFADIMGKSFPKSFREVTVFNYHQK